MNSVKERRRRRNLTRVAATSSRAMAAREVPAGAGAALDGLARAWSAARLWIENPAYAGVILAVTAWLMLLIDLFAFVRPHGLLALYRQPLLELRSFVGADPSRPYQLYAALVAQGLLYWVGWQAARRARGLGAWIIVIWGGVMCGLALLLVYPFDAADIFDNIVHGRILGVYGANPFVVVADRYPWDPFYHYMAWRSSPSAYGPLWEIMAGITARLAGNGIVANVVAFKLLGGVFLAGSVAAVAAILRRVAPDRALAGVLLLAWNPIILYETLGHGHNDIAMVFWILLAAWGLLERRYTVAILALVAGTLVKFIPILMIPAAGLIALRDLPGNRARARFFVVTALAGLALGALLYAPFWKGLETLSITRREHMLTTSLPAAFWSVLQPLWGDERAATLISRLALVLTGLYSLWEGWRAFEDRTWHSFARSAFGICMFYLLVTCLWFQQWYAVWPLALAPLLAPGFLPVLAQLFGFTAQSKAFIFGPMFLWRIPYPDQNWRELRLGPTVLGPAWLLCLYLWSRPLLKPVLRHLHARSPAPEPEPTSPD